jgi:hypothetical protein
METERLEPKLDHLAADRLDIWKVSTSSWHVSIRRSDVPEAVSTHSFF